MLEHGGNLRDAMRRFGQFEVDDWIDLSTGINPHGYPAPAISSAAWQRLPEPDPALLEAACAYYRAPRLLPVAGTQAAIQALPRLRAPSRVAVSAPSYAEHAHHWGQHGHTRSLVPYTELEAAVDSNDVVVVVNPNNPTGETVVPEVLLDWARRLHARGGWLVVDEAFGDTGSSLSVATHAAQPGLIVLRSIGKFFGLAGLRLGFVAAHEALLAELADTLGPWTISGPAQEVALRALEDTQWQKDTRTFLRHAGYRMAQLLNTHGIASAGTPLFRWWPDPEPEAFHAHMAARGIWCRLFSDAARGIRVGLPGRDADWQRLEQALHEWSKQ